MFGKKEIKPSRVTDDYWVYANSKKKYPRPTSNCGKWLVFMYTKDLDETWKKIRKATEKGELGSSSKSSTAKPNPNATNPDTKVICVYTYDSEDKDDVARIAWKLYELVKPRVLNYKKDITTIQGKYAIKGNRKISKYSVSDNQFKDKTKKEFIEFFKQRFE